ncbi:MAG: hypothetical protein QOE01_174 [Actinomycetota bacterium]|jgi:signal transduction histidine kinase|nr:hypothetical protein [Actinomycetota bacterium]
MLGAFFTGSAIVERQRLGLAARATLLLLCSGLSLVDSLHQANGSLDVLGRLSVLVAIAILAVVAGAAWPQSVWVPVAEAASVAVLVMANAGPHQPLLPYLLAPALEAGLIAGVRGAVATAGAAAAMFLAASPFEIRKGQSLTYSSTASEWVLLALATGLLAAWARRLGVRTAGSNEAYPAAYRLMTQLRTVSRHLSGGLDALSLAHIVLQQLRDRTGFDRAAVFVPGPEGELVVLAGEGNVPDWDTSLASDGLMAEVWSQQRGAARQSGFSGTKGLVSMALPLTIGARTVGVVALERRFKWEMEDDIDSLTSILDEAALRIETALLFSEIRTIATAEERRRLAREIHDGIAQELAFLGYVLDDLAARSEQEDMQGELRDLRAQVTRVVGDLRLSIFELRSEVQGQTGLGAALSDYVRSIGAASAMTVHLVLDETPNRLPVEAEAELLRIAQESVTNARKHSGAQNLWVTCRINPPAARLTIEDDGTGLGTGRDDSYGIQIMRERADRLGATLSISTRPEGGTKVDVALQARPVEIASDQGAGRDQ